MRHVQNRAMSRQEMAFSMNHSNKDLRHAYCGGLYAARRFSCANAARYAAVACSDELNVDHRNDLESLAIIAVVLDLDLPVAGSCANMVRLHQAQMRFAGSPECDRHCVRNNQCS